MHGGGSRHWLRWMSHIRGEQMYARLYKTSILAAIANADTHMPDSTIVSELHELRHSSEYLDDELCTSGICTRVYYHHNNGNM
jgi:hypothetical protein